MSRSARMAFACAVVMALGGTAQAEQTASPDPLAQQARYWEARGRDDLAREAWLKLLKARPNDPVALESLKQIEARAGKAPAPGDVSGTATAKGGAPQPNIPQEGLNRARQLSGAGRYDEAVAEYKKAFNGEPKDGPLALEYWQTVGGTRDGWEPARVALERLSKNYPNDPDVQLAYAQHLTYREPSRRQGLDLMDQLSSHDTGRQPVQSSWRQALLWLGAKPGDEQRYKDYIARYGSDTQVVAKLEGIKSGRGGTPGQAGRPGVTDALGLALRNAYREMDAGRLASAEREFNSIRQKWPSSPDGTAGLGIVRLKQERFAESRKLLEQASAQSPHRAGNWASALSAARFWEQARLGQSARDAGDYAQAETHFRTALSRDPAVGAKEPFVRVALADVLTAQKKYTEAEAIYRDVLKRTPGQVEATQGLVNLLAATQRIDEANKLAATLPADRRGGGTKSAGALQAFALRDQATAASKRGDDATAEKLLLQALATDPVSTWPRLDLARLYLREGRQEEARGLVDGLPSEGPQATDASYIRALLASEQGQWFDSLLYLEKIPVASRTKDMADLQRRMWVHYQSERAAIFARRGRTDDAMQILAGVEPYARTPELIGVVAFAYADAGQDGRALYLLRQALSSTTRPDPSLRLAYAGLLLKLNQRTEFDAQLAELERTPNLDAATTATLTDMRVTQRLAQADEVRQSGNVARAYDLLEPLLRIAPEDPRIIMSLARLYDQAQEPDRSLSLYQYAMKVDPTNFDAYQGAVLAANSMGRTDEADDYLDQAMKVAPNDPRAYTLAATVARGRGQDGKALGLLKLALEAGRTPGAGDGLQLQYLGQDLRPIHVEQTGRADVAGPHAMPAAWHPGAVLPRPLLRPSTPRPRTVHAREDRALVATPRWWKTGRLVKVAEPRYPLPELAPPGVRMPATKAMTPALKMDVPAAMSQPPQAFGNAPVQLRMDPVLRSADYAYEKPVVTDTPEDKILTQIAEIEAKRSTTAGAGLALRTRDGIGGLDRLDDIEGPIEASISGADAGRITVRATPAYIDAGTISGTNLPLFGTIALLGPVDGSIDQSDKGVAVGVQYEIANFSIDVGSTPLGFEIPRLVGGVSWKPIAGSWIFGFDVSRRSVTDSLLSYAGTKDPATNEEWGAITATGSHVDVAYDMGDAGIYANGEFHVYDGKRVRHNDEVGGGAGAYFKVYQQPLAQVTVGVNLTTMFFDDNLRHFTWGHGGYFSPQRYISFALPVEISGGTRRLSYTFQGAIGIQNFHEDGAALYPNDAGLQAQIETLAADDPDAQLVAGYDSNTHTGGGYSFYGAVEYLIANNLVVGATAGFDNAADYDETKVLAYLRYSVAKQPQVSKPPRPVVPFYDFPKKLP